MLVERSFVKTVETIFNGFEQLPVPINSGSNLVVGKPHYASLYRHFIASEQNLKANKNICWEWCFCVTTDSLTNFPNFSGTWFQQETSFPKVAEVDFWVIFEKDFSSRMANWKVHTRFPKIYVLSAKFVVWVFYYIEYYYIYYKFRAQSVSVINNFCIRNSYNMWNCNLAVLMISRKYTRIRVCWKFIKILIELCQNH